MVRISWPGRITGSKKSRRRGTFVCAQARFSDETSPLATTRPQSESCAHFRSLHCAVILSKLIAEAINAIEGSAVTLERRLRNYFRVCDNTTATLFEG